MNVIRQNVMQQKLWEIENFIKKFTMYKTVDLRKMKKIKKKYI